ncbi:PREDICTED: cathepsin L1-like, partial [Rhagoletis zephyria]|uniref:cathepsin L1-like n=1 Tax=Rhagoletis zephyria TaxID=28612 RepID=UPI0008113FA3
MNANPMAQRNYRGGVYEGADCTTAVNHAVTLVGGGSSYLAFSYLKRNGVTSEEAMPYTASDGFCMSMFRSLPDEVPPISDYCIRSRIRYTFLSRTEEVSEEDMRRTLVAVGPLYVAMNANPMAQRNYRGGVYEGADCTTAVNHAVTLVGYTPDAWIIKNSWGR